MGTQNTAFKIMLAATLAFASTPAFAQVPPLEPLNHNVRYDVYWNGIPLGRVRIKAHEDMFSYGVSVDTKTRGLADIFAESTSTAKANGLVREGDYIPKLYDSRSSSKKKRVVTIHYNEEGGIETRSRTPMDSPEWRPVVPVEQANEATDPVTAFLTLRKTMHSNIANNVKETQIKTYDGARLALMTFTVVSRASLTIMDKSVRAINIVPERTLLNGYTPKEIKKHEKGDPVVHLYFSADGRFIPLLAEVNLAFGTLKAELTEIE